jgi:hypothetical protein
MPRIFACTLLAVSAVCSCAEDKAYVRPVARPNGMGVQVAPPGVSIAAGTTCAPNVVDGIADRFQSAAQDALTNVGFAVVSHEGTPLHAKLTLIVDYCSEAGIVSGSTSLSLEKSGQGTVWSGQTTGDQARAETANSTLQELVGRMVLDERVIKATEHAR